MHIFELFDAPTSHPTRWRDYGSRASGSKIAQTQFTSDRVLEVFFLYRPPEYVSISFSVDNSMGITNSGDHFEVFATVAANIKEWLKTNSPTFIKFTAASDEPSRVKLYQRMASRIPGYTNISNNEELWPPNFDTRYDNTHDIPFVLIKSSELRGGGVPKKNNVNELFDKPAINKTDWETSHYKLVGRTILTSGKLLRTSFFLIRVYDDISDEPDAGSVAYSRTTIVFSVDSVEGITGSNEHFEVFATVAANIKEWLNRQGNRPPNFITFTADNDEPSRVKLYARMASRIPGYTNISDHKELWPSSLKEEDSSYESMFVLKRI